MKTQKIIYGFFLLTFFFQYGVAQNIQSIPLKGLSVNNEGIFAWNDNLNGVGHLIVPPYNAFGNQNAYYFIATSDYLNFNPASTTGLHGVNNLTGFPNLATALVSHNKTLADINVQFGFGSLWGDLKGVGKDWNHVGSTETRRYKGGTFKIRLGNEDLLSGTMPDIHLTIEYGSEFTPFDDIISGFTDYVSPVKAVVAGSTNAANGIANALMKDIANHGVRFNFSSLQPAGQTEYKVGNITGGFFDVQSGLLETSKMAIPFFGDTISFCAGDSVLLDAGAGKTGYLWSNGATTQKIKVSQNGTYYVRIDSLGVLATSSPVELIMKNPTSSTQNVTACNSAVINGKTYTISQIVVDKLTAKNGCDSTVTTNLTINKDVNFSQDLTAIKSAVINGNTYTTSQTIVDTMKTTFGCDSIITTNLTINPTTAIGELKAAEANIRVFPNPFTNDLNLEYTLDEVSDVTIQLLSVLGNKVYESVNKEQAVGNHKINLAGAVTNSGVYNLVLTINNKRFASRVVKID